MSERKYTAAEIVGINWHWAEGRHNQTVEMNLAAALETARHTRRAADALCRIALALESLGADGLHGLIREHADRADEARRKRTERRRKALRVARQRRKEVA